MSIGSSERQEQTCPLKPDAQAKNARRNAILRLRVRLQFFGAPFLVSLPKTTFLGDLSNDVVPTGKIRPGWRSLGVFAGPSQGFPDSRAEDLRRQSSPPLDPSETQWFQAPRCSARPAHSQGRQQFAPCRLGTAELSPRRSIALSMRATRFLSRVGRAATGDRYGRRDAAHPLPPQTKRSHHGEPHWLADCLNGCRRSQDQDLLKWGVPRSRNFDRTA